MKKQCYILKQFGHIPNSFGAIEGQGIKSMHSNPENHAENSKIVKLKEELEPLMVKANDQNI